MSILRGIVTGGMALALSFAHAQHWEPAGIPAYLYMPNPYICYADTSHDALYLGGTCLLNGGNVGHYLLYRYQGGAWDSIGSFGNVIRAAIVFQDTLIVGGAFFTVGDSAIEKIACYVNGAWHPYGNIHGAVSRLRVIDGELYALGIFDTADGSFCNGLAKRVGGHWVNVGVLPTFNGDGSGWFQDAIRYQGRLIVSGNFTSLDHTINDVMAYDGSTWQPICDCLSGGFDSTGPMAVYQGSLYLGGVFYYGSGNAGQGLMRWDGDQWSRVGLAGGGLQIYDHSDAYSPTIDDFKIRDGLLLVGGLFSFADHIPASGIASWDGNHWCNLGGVIDFGVTAMAFYHDTLYVGCGPNIDGQSVNGVARFIGSTYQENCAEVGIAEATRSEDALHVLAPRPGTIVLTGLSDGPHELRIYDAEGRVVLMKQVFSASGQTNEIDVQQYGSALYIVRVDGLQTAKFIPLQ